MEKMIELTKVVMSLMFIIAVLLCIPEEQLRKASQQYQNNSIPRYNHRENNHPQFCSNFNIMDSSPYQDEFHNSADLAVRNLTNELFPTEVNDTVGMNSLVEMTQPVEMNQLVQINPVVDNPHRLLYNGAQPE